MSKIFKYVSWVRTNWKKSTFACVVLGYGAKYGQDQYEIQQMMRGYCEEAALLGEVPAYDAKSSQIAVILNPAANRRNAKKNFEKYCAPLLHLSGAYVTVIETTHEGHARKIPDELDPKTTAILIAGGDGTLSEAVTGLMRGRNETLLVPVGVLPLGRYNTLASHLFGSSPCEVETMAAATMAVVRGKTKRLNTYRVETLDGTNEKAIYGVGLIEWGTWPWLKKRVKELWYCGPLKNYIPLLWPIESAMKPSVIASVVYTAPCAGCSKCYDQRPDLIAAESHAKMAHGGNRWWSAFVKKPQTAPSINYKNVENEACDIIVKKSILTTDLRLATDVIEYSHSAGHVDAESLPPSLLVSIGDEKRYQGDFFREGLKFLNGKRTKCVELIQAKQIEIIPSNPSSIEEKKDEENDGDEVILIDNEEFELRPIRVTILPNSLTVFCP